MANQFAPSRAAERGVRVLAIVILALLTAARWQASGACAQCQTGQIIDPNGPHVAFGAGPVLQGDRAVIGAPDYNGVNRVHLYRESEAGWTLEHTIIDPQLDPKSSFGFANAMSGNWLVVGAYWGAGPKVNSGVAFVYDVRDGAPLLQAILRADDGAYGDDFGWSVAIDREVIVVGSRANDVDTFSSAGSAYVFELDRARGDWIESQQLTAPVSEDYGLMGSSVAIDGDVIVVGAHGTSAGRGAAYIFRRIDGHWEYEQTLKAFDATLDMRFGQSVAIRSDRILVGAPIAGTPIATQPGAAYVFRYSGSRWKLEQKLFASHPVGPSTFFGCSVSLTSDSGRFAALVGANGDHQTGFEGGATHVYQESQGVWKEIAKLIPSDPHPFSGFGSAIATEGDRALISATGDSGGSAYLFVGITSPDCNGNGQADTCDLLAGTSQDHDGDGVPDECEVPADLNGDRTVDLADLSLLLEHWGICPPPCAADLNGDGVINTLDLGILLANWTL